jgi:hypothetical protein
MKKNIISCNLGTPKGPAPKTLREVGADRIVGRKITRWSSDLGSYGMGGCGLFGAQLSQTSELPEEWLILMLWSAPDWLVIDGEVASSGVIQRQLKRQQRMARFKHRLYQIQLKLLLLGSWFRTNLLGWHGLPEWDKFSKKIIGSTIIHADVTDISTRIILRKGNKEHVLEISVPSRWQWNDAESHLDAWAMSDTTTIYC